MLLSGSLSSDPSSNRLTRSTGLGSVLSCKAPWHSMQLNFKKMVKVTATVVIFADTVIGLIQNHMQILCVCVCVCVCVRACVRVFSLK